MGPEFVRDDQIMRVDGDVLEVFDPQYHARRIPLVWLAVRAEALRKDKVVIYIGQNNVDQPLYAPGEQAPTCGAMYSRFTSMLGKNGNIAHSSQRLLGFADARS